MSLFRASATCAARARRSAALRLICYCLIAVAGRAQEDEWYVKPLFSLASTDIRTINVRPLLSVACPGKALVRTDRVSREIGCSTCPPGSDFYIDRDTMSASLQAVTFGHF